MTPPPNDQVEQTARPATQLLVRRGDEQGNPPGVSEETEELRVLAIHRFVGARRVDYCELAVDLGWSGQRLQDLETPEGWARQIEVRVPDPDDPLVSLESPFWGELGAQKIRLGRDEESARVLASVEPYHFGIPLAGVPVWDSTNDEEITVDLDPVFNPLIDRKIEPNRDELRGDLADSGISIYAYHLWYDPERARSGPARGYHSDSSGAASFPELWTIPTAVQSLCAVCNPEQTFIQNPQLDPADDIFADAPALNNVRLPRGLYLPEYLDLLLHPNGYDWYLDVTQDADGDLVREIVVFPRGSGDEKEVYFQSPGETLDLKKQNVQDLNVETSIVELANRFVGYGSLKEAEITIELERTWITALDSLQADDLRKENEDGTANDDYETYWHVWRHWIGNEGYDSLRDGLPDAPPDFSTLFDKCVVKRRPLGRTLTLDADGKRRKPFLEWSNDAGSTWNPWNTSEEGFGPYRLLEDQIGIYFDDQTPPSELVAAGDDARLRITGTITADERLTHTVEKQESSPNLRDVTLFLDLSDRFHWHNVTATGTFVSTLVDDENGADETDDSDALQEYLEQLQPTADSAFVAARIELHGLHFDYQIGNLVPGVSLSGGGRNIAFNRNSPGVAEKKYLQIDGISWNMQEQSTILHVVAVENR